MRSELRKAIRTGRNVNIIYMSRSGVISKRMIYIFSLRNERIIAYCYIRCQMRIFKVENILAMEESRQQTEVFV